MIGSGFWDKHPEEGLDIITFNLKSKGLPGLFPPEELLRSDCGLKGLL